MQLELHGGAVQLQRGETLRLRDAAGHTVCAREGTLWITEENRPRDVVLEAGNCYRVHARGLTLIEALGSASVQLT